MLLIWFSNQDVPLVSALFFSEIAQIMYCLSNNSPAFIGLALGSGCCNWPR